MTPLITILMYWGAFCKKFHYYYYNHHHHHHYHHHYIKKNCINVASLRPFNVIILRTFIPDLACCIGAYQYYIHDKITIWSEAVKSCQQNGSVLAVLDSQDKLDELATKLSSLGYNNGDRFWIGLFFNASIHTFQWGSRITVNETIRNSICGGNPDGISFQRNNWCYLLKHVDSASPCFQRWHCDKKHGSGYICQVATSANGNYNYRSR